MGLIASVCARVCLPKKFANGPKYIYNAAPDKVTVVEAFLVKFCYSDFSSIAILCFLGPLLALSLRLTAAAAPPQDSKMRREFEK